MRARFNYCFAAPPGSEYPPIVSEHAIVAGEPITIAGAAGPIVAIPYLQDHGDIQSLGFRVDGLAYSADLKSLPESSIAVLRGLDVWIVDALRYAPHPSHLSVAEALDWIARIGPKRAILTNLHADLDYAELSAKLPSHVEPAFDGMRVSFPQRGR
jgi:phosphoribosyl 1,2-cyclic phosphate phosphodiesterase